MSVTFSVYVCAYGIFFLPVQTILHYSIYFDIHMPNKHSLKCNYVCIKMIVVPTAKTMKGKKTLAISEKCILIFQGRLSVTSIRILVSPL